MSENKHKYCMYCGTKLENDWLFCKECGNKLEKVLEEDTAVEETNVIVNDIESEEIQDSVEEIVENENVETEETMDEVEPIVEEVSETLDEAEVPTKETDDENTEEELVEEEIIYKHNRDYLVDLYNNVAKRNSMTIFNIFLPSFLIMVLFFFDYWIITGIIAIIIGFLAYAIIVGNKSYKKNVDIISQGISKLEIEEKHFVIKERIGNIYEHSVVQYKDVLGIEENDNIIVVTTDMGRLYIIDKKALKDKLVFFRNSILNYAKSYNGKTIKKEDLPKGKYDYYPETDKTISVVRAKEKSVTANIITIFSFVAKFILGYITSYLFIVLLFIPIGIIELVYISKLNKKIQNNLKIVAEKVVAIILTALSGFMGLISLLSLIA